MNKLEETNKTYEELVDEYLKAKSKAQVALIEYADVIAKALRGLEKRKWIEWLSDERIGLNKSQAYKFVALSEHCKKSVQLTGLLKSNQVEKAYLLTKVKNPEYQKELAEQIIEAEYTVKQTKEIVSKLRNENKTPNEAIEEVKNQPKSASSRPERKTVPIEEFNNLKAEYDKLLREKNELENKLKEQLDLKCKNAKEKSIPKMGTTENLELLEPIDSVEPDFTIDEITHSVVFKGKKVPISKDLRLIGQLQNYLEIIVVKEAKEKFGLELS